MKLFKISFHRWGYDQYDSFLVAANRSEDVLPFIQSKYNCSKFDGTVDVDGGYLVEYINPKKYTEPTVIMESFNAG